MNIGNKLINIVLSDIPERQELRRKALILRMNSLIMCIYFLVLLLSFFGMSNLFIPACAIPCFIVYLILFYLTYQDKYRVAMIVQNVISTVFIILFIYMFGWWCGVQHFIFVTVVIIYTASTYSFRMKGVLVAILVVFRLLLNQYTNFYPPVVNASEVAENYFQFVNTVTIFIAVATCLYIYTKDAQKTENQLQIMTENDKLSYKLDLLTGLYNRKAISEYLVTTAEEKRDGQGSNICVAIGDIDDFRRINEKYGQACGDVILRQVANQLREYMDDKGIVGRWSGVEFLLIFEDVLKEEALKSLAMQQEKLQNVEFSYQGEAIHLSMTFGLQEYSFDESADSNIAEAEKIFRQMKKAAK